MSVMNRPTTQKMEACKGGEVEMTIKRMIELLDIEHECMLRKSHDDCNRNCADCDLVQDDDELHEMYTNVISLLKEQEPKQVIGIADSIEGMEVGYCPSCNKGIVNKKIDETKFCKFCGQKVKWDG